MPTLEKKPSCPQAKRPSHAMRADISSARLVVIRPARGSLPTFISAIDHNLEIHLELFMRLTSFDHLHLI